LTRGVTTPESVKQLKSSFCTKIWSIWWGNFDWELFYV